MQAELIYIVDDDASVRDSLSLLLSLRGYVTATFASAEAFLSALQADWSGCLIIDIRMPGMSGLELLQYLTDRSLRFSSIIVTAHGDIAAVRQAFLANAVDFIEKPYEESVLLEATERALSALRKRRSSLTIQRESAAALAKLSPRELQVVELVAQGRHNKVIAAELGISPRTVEVHRARAMSKLEARSVAELVHLTEKARH